MQQCGWRAQRPSPGEFLQTPSVGASTFTGSISRDAPGEESGPELSSLSPVERRAGNFIQLWFLEQPDPREPHREVPSRTAGLVTTRFRCCDKGPRVRVADKVCLSLQPTLEADRPGLVWQGCSRKLLSRRPRELSSCWHSGQEGVPASELAFPAAGQRESQQEGQFLSPRHCPRSCPNCLSFHPGGKAWSRPQPRCRRGWDFCSPGRPRTQLEVSNGCSERAVGKVVGNHLDNCATHLLRSLLPPPGPSWTHPSDKLH